LSSGRAWLLLWWSLSCFGQCVALPIRALRTGTVQFVTRINKGSSWGKFYLVGHLTGFISLLVVAPLLAYRGPGGRDTAVVFVLYNLTAGLLFGVFTQASHLNPHSIEASYKVGSTETFFPWMSR
jgi:hypothetical protein